MDTNILLVFDIDLGTIRKDAGDIKEDDIVNALRFSVETLIREHLKDQRIEDAIKLVLSTTNTDPHFSNAGSAKCTVHHIPNPNNTHNRYLICGDSSLCKDLRKKIGSQASVFGTDPKI